MTEKRMPGRKLGTKFGDKEHQSARRNNRSGKIVQAVGAIIKGVGLAEGIGGSFPTGVATYAAGHVLTETGETVRKRARSRAARATAVE